MNYDLKKINKFLHLINDIGFFSISENSQAVFKLKYKNDNYKIMLHYSFNDSKLYVSHFSFYKNDLLEKNLSYDKLYKKLNMIFYEYFRKIKIKNLLNE